MQDAKQERQQAIESILDSAAVSSQQQLQNALAARGFEADQSTVSRDLSEMGVFKLHGTYRLGNQSSGAFIGSLQGIDTAGDHLIVLKTAIGQAQIVALTIDHAALPEIVGTVAGDDTIFVAVRNAAARRKAVRSIQRILAEPEQGHN